MLAKDSVQQRLERGPLVHRVQLHDPPGLRLRDAVPRARRRDADGRRGPVGQHHGRPRAHPPNERRRRREPRPRHRVQAAAVAVGGEVRQERGRRLGVARPRADDALRVLPVLGAGGRPRRRDVPAVVHGAPAGADRGARRRGRRPSRAARGAAGAGARRHDAGPRRGRGRGRGARLRGAVPARADHRPRAAGRRPRRDARPDGRRGGRRRGGPARPTPASRRPVARRGG